MFHLRIGTCDICIFAFLLDLKQLKGGRLVMGKNVFKWTRDLQLKELCSENVLRSFITKSSVFCFGVYVRPLE